MATTDLDDVARLLLRAFASRLNRLNPAPEDWRRFYDFILHAVRHGPASGEAVGHVLIQEGLDWEEAEPFVLLYRHAGELLQRYAATKPAAGGGPPRRGAR